MLAPGTIIGGKYRVTRLIGDGGMGSVYEAVHQVLGSKVALKFLHPEIAQQPGLKQRFLQEARVSATVQNEHIVRVSDVDTDAEGAYLVMELLKGEPLIQLIQREGRLDVERSVHFALQICAGLEAAHELQIVHRDLKPDNVFVTPTTTGPLLKLLDFGIAKLRQSEEYQMTLTRPGAVMGTPEYMAPEQAFGADTADQRSDIYSLGVMLFEMLSGKLPVNGDNPQEIAEKIMRGQTLHLDQARPELPKELVRIVERATASNPDRRFNNVRELRQALLPFAPLSDRASAVSLLPEMGRGFVTGMATPFVPVQATPVVQHPAAAGSAASSPAASNVSVTGVPRTIPPDDHGPPAASRQFEPPRARTQGMAELPMALSSAMPNAPSAAHYAVTSNPAASYPAAPNTTATVLRRRGNSGSIWPWIAVAVLVIGSGVVGLVFYESYASYPSPPPQPVLKVPASGKGDSVVDLGVPVPDEPEVAPIGGGARAPRGGAPLPRTPGNPQSPALPPLTLPTQLPSLPPLPTELPAGLPSTFPQLPGFPPASPSQNIAPNSSAE